MESLGVRVSDLRPSDMRMDIARQVVFEVERKLEDVDATA